SVNTHRERRRHFALSLFRDTRHRTTTIADGKAGVHVPQDREAATCSFAISTPCGTFPRANRDASKSSRDSMLRRCFGSRSVRGSHKSLLLSRSNGGEV